MNLDRKVIADISEGHGHDRRVEGARMEWIGSDGKGGGAGGGGAGQASQMWADITALYFTLPQQWSGHDSATQFLARLQKKVRYKSKIWQCSATVYSSSATFTLQCTMGRKVQCYIILHCYMGVYRYGAGGR